MANAVMDGADAFLLGAETLRGVHPVLTIATILSIARQAEAVFDHTHHFDHLMTVGLLPLLRMILKKEIWLGSTSITPSCSGSSADKVHGGTKMPVCLHRRRR